MFMFMLGNGKFFQSNLERKFFNEGALVLPNPAVPLSIGLRLSHSMTVGVSARSTIS